MNDFELAASQGTLKDRYLCYVANMVGQGKDYLTFDDWLNS